MESRKTAALPDLKVTNGAMEMDIHEIVTDRIINLLEQGVVPWRKPWTSAGCAASIISADVLPQQEMLLGLHLADNRHCLFSKAGALVCPYNCTLQVFMGRTASAVRRLDAGKTQ